jgi:hypothetical protein
MNLNKVIVAVLRARMQEAVDVVLEREDRVHEGGLLDRAQVTMVSSDVHLAGRRGNTNPLALLAAPRGFARRLYHDRYHDLSNGILEL